MTIPLYQDKTPTEPGQYIFRGAFTGDIEMITVVWRESSIDRFPSLVVVKSLERHVAGLVGFFSDKLEFTY